MLFKDLSKNQDPPIQSLDFGNPIPPVRVKELLCLQVTKVITMVDSNVINWSPETEVCLFYAMRGQKPTGKS